MYKYLFIYLVFLGCSTPEQTCVDCIDSARTRPADSMELDLPKVNTYIDIDSIKYIVNDTFSDSFFPFKLSRKNILAHYSCAFEITNEASPNLYIDDQIDTCSTLKCVDMEFVFYCTPDKEFLSKLTTTSEKVILHNTIHNGMLKNDFIKIIGNDFSGNVVKVGALEGMSFFTFHFTDEKLSWFEFSNHIE